MKRLKALDVDEVSLVDIGANKKKFLIFKSKSGSKKMGIKEAIKSLRVKKDVAGAEEDKKESAKKANDEVEKAELSEGAQAALKAIARILTPFKDELSDSDVDSVLSELGIDMGSEGEVVEASKEKGEDDEVEKAEDEDLKKLFALPAEVKEEHAAEALNKAKEAMGEHLEKLGYEKYKSEEEPAMKSKEDEVQKAKIDQIFKSNKELVQKNADLEKRINEMTSKESEKEVVQKAASFTHLGIKSEELVEVLKAAKTVGQKHYDTVCKQYAALNEQAKKSDIFKSYGSNLSNGGASDAEAKIDAAVREVVQKSGKTQAQAYSDFMNTDEGKRLYGEMKAQRPGGI
jgi:hypothetical protein